jgi:hypothetical protein
MDEEDKLELKKLFYFAIGESISSWAETEALIAVGGDVAWNHL